MEIELIESEDGCAPSQPAPNFQAGVTSSATVTIDLPEERTQGFNVIISSRTPQSVQVYRKLTEKTWTDLGYKWRGDTVADAGKGAGWMYAFHVGWYE